MRTEHFQPRWPLNPALDERLRERARLQYDEPLRRNLTVR